MHGRALLDALTKPFQGGRRETTSSGVIVVGLGRFGEAVARELVHQGIQVLAMDEDPEIVARLANELPDVVQIDATNADALRQAGAESFQRAVVAIATNVEASVLAAVALLDDLGMQEVWAKALSAQHARILERVGVHRVVQPEHEMGLRTARGLARGVTDYVRIEDDFALVEVRAPESFVGKTLGESGIRSRFKVTVVSVKPAGGSFHHAGLDTVLDADELILVAGRPEDLDKFISEA
jgi:trk system potassium uptake protein TrkA